jgi:hypothetical protein
VGHQVHVAARPELLGDEAEDRLGLVELAGHDEVAQDHAPAGQPALVEDEVADLAVHLFDRLACDLGVVRPLEISARPLARPDLEVGHVDVHDAVHQPQAVEAVVRARVVDDRQLEAADDGVGQGLEYLRDDVLRRDPVDVVAADRLELEHHRPEPLRRRALAPNLPRDFVVLAKDAAQVAAAEEDRAGAVTPAQAVLLAEMREVRGDDRPAADRAEAYHVLAPVDLAAARTDDAARSEKLVSLGSTSSSSRPRAR